jgi:flagellar biosynthesis anti-sigma factor FlgM
MRIDSNQSAQPLAESGRNSGPAVAGVDPRAVASGRVGAAVSLGEDQAQFSGSHEQVQALVAEALQFPETRQEKVNALRQVVQEGSYQPGSSRVADALFTHLLVEPAA